MNAPRRRLDARTVFLSDLHLGSPNCHAEALVDFLANLRAGLVVASVIPLSMLGALTGMLTGMRTGMFTGAITGTLAGTLGATGRSGGFVVGRAVRGGSGAKLSSDSAGKGAGSGRGARGGSRRRASARRRRNQTLSTIPITISSRTSTAVKAASAG